MEKNPPRKFRISNVKIVQWNIGKSSKMVEKISSFSIFPPMGNSTLAPGRSGLRSDVQLVAGPSTIQTLRGQLCGREAGFGRSIWMGFTLW